MERTQRFEPQSADDAFQQIIEARPAARVAAVRPDGLFCEMPATILLQGQEQMTDVRAGIDLVAREFRAAVLEQFRQLRPDGVSEIEVRMASGGLGHYAIFDLRKTHGVFMLVVTEEEPGSERSSRNPVNDAAPVRPRSGRAKRTQLAELIDVDENLLGMLGYSAEAFAALDTATAVHPEDYDALIGYWFDLLSAEPGSTRRVRVRYLRGDGSWLWVEITISQHLDDAEQPHMITELVDISEEMAAIDEVWRGRELLSRLTEALPVGVLQIDADGTVVYSNDRLHDMLGNEGAGNLTALLEGVAAEDRNTIDLMVRRALEQAVDGECESRIEGERISDIRFLRLVCRALRDRKNEVVGAIICVSDETDSTRLRNELSERATIDMLTECLNRGAIMDCVNQALAEKDHGTALIFVDLDEFKPINDRLGHAAGDELLKTVAGALRKVVRGDDVVGRLGGDEFVVLCPNVPHSGLAEEIGTRVSRALAFTTTVGGEIVRVSASVGVAWSEDTATTPDALVATADQAMYESKRSMTKAPVLAICG